MGNKKELIAAVRAGNAKKVELLLKKAPSRKSASPDTIESDGWPVLYTAAYYGYKKTVETLLRAGAQVDLAEEDMGTTPLYIAAQNGHKEVVEILLRAGAKVDSVSEDHDGTPFCVAAQNRHREVMEILLRAGAKVDSAKKDGATPLYFAAQNGHKEIVEMLLSVGAKVYVVMDDGTTALYIAAQNGYKEIVEMLLRAGAKVDMVVDDGTTALYIAAQNGHKEIVEMLYHAGGNHQIKTTSGTPFEVAQEQGHKDIVDFLSHPPVRKKKTQVASRIMLIEESSKEKDRHSAPQIVVYPEPLPPQSFLQLKQSGLEQKSLKRKPSDYVPESEASPTLPEKKARHEIDHPKEFSQPSPRVTAKIRLPCKAGATAAALVGVVAPAAVTYPFFVPEPPMHITVTYSEFKPGIQPELIDYSGSSRFFRATMHKKLPEHKKIMQSRIEQRTMHKDTEEHTEYSDKARSAIGRWGEDFVYNLLWHHYQEKHPKCNLIQQENGFKLTGFDGLSIEVVWHNKNEESFESKDFTVMKHKPGGVEKHYVIEVKTTTSVGQNIAFLSKHEWQQMLECSASGQKYRIFRVHNAGQTNPTVGKIKDPLQKIIAGEIEVSEMKFKI